MAVNQKLGKLQFDDSTIENQARQIIISFFPQII